MSDVPLYCVAEAARYLRMPSSTAYSWSMGRNDTGAKSVPALIEPADPATPLLSFSNLVELHILASMRSVHGLTPKTIRKALNYLETKMKIDRPLLHQEMKTDGKDIFIKWHNKNVDISNGGQLRLWEEDFDLRLTRVGRDSKGVLTRLFPFTRPDTKDTPTLIALDPTIRYGRPCITGTRLSTDVIAGRYRAGDSVDTLAADYERRTDEIEEAIRYESKAAA